MDDVRPCDACGCICPPKEPCSQIECTSNSPGPAAELEALHLTDNTGLSDAYVNSRAPVLSRFGSQFSDTEQMDLVMRMLKMMRHPQHSVINTFLGPMLQRDFVSLLPARGLATLADSILSYVDAQSLCQVERVCRSWRARVADGQLWRKLIERKVRTDTLWRGLSERRGWRKYLFRSRDQLVPLVLEAWSHAQKFYGETDLLIDADGISDTALLHYFYRKLYPEIVSDMETIEDNWKLGRHGLHRINCHSENSKGVYCLQYDGEKIVSGLRDNTIKVWNVRTMQPTMVLTGHTGSVLCLQYDERAIISGSSDSTVRVWDVDNGEVITTLVHHCEAVLHLRFHDGMMVTCSKDRSIAVWDMASPKDITLRRVLVGHRAAVNVVDFDARYIVSASGDRTIKVWSADTCEFLRTLSGHRRGIACLQYRDNLVVSGSSDNTIRLWDIETGQCLRTLEGHEELVRCIRFDSKHIVSGAYDGKIKVWDLAAALDARTPLSQVCLVTLNEHTGRVFRLQFDEFQIVSSSHDDTILIWDFINYNPDNRARLPLVFSASPPSECIVAPNNSAADAEALAVPPAVGDDGDEQVVDVQPADHDGDAGVLEVQAELDESDMEDHQMLTD